MNAIIFIKLYLCLFICLDQTRLLQEQKLKDLSSKYERDKKILIEAVGDLQMKVKVKQQMKSLDFCVHF